MHDNGVAVPSDVPNSILTKNYKPEEGYNSFAQQSFNNQSFTTMDSTHYKEPPIPSYAQNPLEKIYSQMYDPEGINTETPEEEQFRKKERAARKKEKKKERTTEQKKTEKEEGEEGEEDDDEGMIVQQKVKEQDDRKKNMEKLAEKYVERQKVKQEKDKKQSKKIDIKPQKIKNYALPPAMDPSNQFKFNVFMAMKTSEVEALERKVANAKKEEKELAEKLIALQLRNRQFDTTFATIS